MSPRILEQVNSVRNLDIQDTGKKHDLTVRDGKHDRIDAPEATSEELGNFEGKAAYGVVRDRINHKVEQIIRAIYLGLDEQNVDCTKGTALENFKPLDWIVIGIADERGYRFKPDTNTRLAMMGLHPTSVLASLSRMRLHGVPVVAVEGELLLALHGAVAQNARDQLFNTKKLLDFHNSVGKPALFA